MGQIEAQATTEMTDPAAVIARSSFLKALPAEALAGLASEVEQVEAAAGAVLVREGQENSYYYVIATGDVEVWATRGLAQGETAPEDWATPWRPNHLRHILLNRLGPGDGFGEMGMLLGGHSRATVRAASDVVLYRIAAPVFSAIARSHRDLVVAVEEEMALRSAANFLGKPAPFAQVPRGALRLMAARAQKVHLDAGEEIVRQGELANAFYLIVRGQVAVVMTQPDATEHKVATLGPGDPFGQMELLTEERSTATVRTLEDVEALRLGKDDFRHLLQQYRERKKHFLRLVLRREPLVHNSDWVLETHEGSEGQILDVLQDVRNDRYITLSPKAVLLWELIDGRRSVRDLAVSFLARFESSDLDGIMELILQLHAAGAIDIGRRGAPAAAQGTSRPAAVARDEASPSPVAYLPLPGVDKAATYLYRFLLKPLYSLPCQAIMLAATLLGAALFLVQVALGVALPAAGVQLEALAAGTVFGLLIHGLAHEVAHAVTCKHFGCPVPRAGVGWCRFLPVAYVDMTSAWAASPAARFAIHIAGPRANGFLSGLAVLAAPVVDDPATRTALLCSAVVGYFFVLANLNPFTASDAYDALADRFLVFDLREESLAFLRSMIWGETLTTVAGGRVRAYAGYASLVLVFATTLSGLVLIGYHGYVMAPLLNLLPQPVVSAIGWLAALVVFWAVLRGALRDLRPGSPGTPPAEPTPGSLSAG